MSAAALMTMTHSMMSAALIPCTGSQHDEPEQHSSHTHSMMTAALIPQTHSMMAALIPHTQ